jgi:hypothetical protein
MPNLRITIPGAFEDAFYYMGQLIAVTADRTLVAIDLERTLYEHFHRRVPAIYQFYFLHNEWLDRQHVKLLLSIPEVDRGLWDAGKRHESLVIEPTWQRINTSGENPGRGAVLDLQAYNRRLYISTTEGLFDADFSVSYGDLELGDVKKRLDARCISTSLKYGSLVASCGSEGLFAAYDDFGAIGQDRPPLQRAEEASSRASWFGYSLTNYSNATSLQFLSGHRQDTNKRRASVDTIYQESIVDPVLPISTDRHGQQSVVVTGLEEDARSSKRLAEDAAGADFVANSFNYFFIHMPTSEYRFYMRRHRNGHIVGARADESTGEVDTVLSTHTFHSGIVVESFNSVCLITPVGANRIYDGAALKVRTFPSGTYGVNVIAVVDEEGLNLISPLRYMGNPV